MKQLRTIEEHGPHRQADSRLACSLRTIQILVSLSCLFLLWSGVTYRLPVNAEVVILWQGSPHCRLQHVKPVRIFWEVILVLFVRSDYESHLFDLEAW